MTDHEYAELLYKTAMADGNFVPLLTRLEHVIEHNVSIESLLESKRIFIERIGQLAQETAPVLKLNRSQSSEVVKTMGVLLVGAARADQGPSLEGEAIPADVRMLIESFSSKNIFVKNACRIVAGIRRDEIEAS